MNRAPSTSWLMGDTADRERLREAGVSLAPSRQLTLAIMGLALAAMGPWLGWWTLAPLVATVFVYKGADFAMDRIDRPEIAIFAAWCASEVILATSVQLSGGIGVPTVCWLALPMVTLSYRFTLRGVLAGTAFVTLLLCGLAMIDARTVIDYPPVLIAPFVLLVGTTILSLAILDADQRVRRVAVVDHLTGLLNRHALSSRVDELRQQALATGQPIGLVLLDVDHFKQINDRCGHAVGDAVLTELAALVTKNVRAFDLAYRVGGEEILVLLPGSPLEEATGLATRLRAAVAESPLAGQPVTISVGVSATEPGEPFHYTRQFEAADRALYAAKSQGRNCVRVADPEQRLCAIAA